MDNNNKEKYELIKITPDQMFLMIEDFAQGLMNHCREKELINEETMMLAFREIMDTFKTLNLESRVCIVTCLFAASSLYQTSVEGLLHSSLPPCPEHLN